MEQNNKPQVTPQVPPNKEKQFTYTCIEKCVYRGKLWRVGDVIRLDKSGEKVSHFKEAKIT